MKLKIKGKKINASLSALFGRGKEHGDQFTDQSNALPSIVIRGESSEATENSRDTRDEEQDGVNTDTQCTTTSAHRSNTPNFGGSNHEALDIGTQGSSGFLNHAHHVILANPMMVDKSTTNIINQVASDREVKAKELLSKHIIQGAAHDSSARDPPPQCHPGTRISINEQIMAWFYDKKKQELILWIYGPAGVGKSAIVQTIADTLAGAKCLGASVFFSRPNGRNNSRSVFITIAYQLAVRIPAYSVLISEKLASDPELVNKGMKEQFKTFIVEPFVENRIGADEKTWGILLDGLDELDEKRWQREIIRLVTAFALEHPNVPLAWVISSRPEPHIVDTFRAKQIASSYWKEFIPVDSTEACQDVERYLRSSFETIREDFPRIASQDWPEEIKFTQLAHAASGLFAFADVAVRFIGDARHADPVTRLDDVLAVIEHSGAKSGEEQPFAHLDALYMRILASIPRKTWPVTQQILVAIEYIPTSVHCTKGLSVVLGIELSKIYTAINDLYSILNISPDNVYSVLRFHHASFVDFLREPTRSMEFYTPFEDISAHIDDCGARIWLDFHKQSPLGPTYPDRWRKYALRFHSDVNVLDKMSMEFSYELFKWINRALFWSLSTKLDLALTEPSPENWDQVVEMLCQVEHDAFSLGRPRSYELVSALFGIWKIRHKDLTETGIVHEIRLDQLQLDHLWWPEDSRTHGLLTFNRHSSKAVQVWISSWYGNRADEYVSGLKHFQQQHPTLPVLICGSRGNRFAVFIHEYTRDDFTERPLHAQLDGELDFDEYLYQGYYYIPYSDGV